MTIDGPANPTQLTGIVCFALASAACGFAARRGSRAWLALALAQAAFCIEIVVGSRHRIHGAVVALLQDHGWYSGRTPWQFGLLAIVALLAMAAAALWAWRGRRRDRLVTTALVASVAVAASFAIEAVSLHDVDGLIYRRVGPLLAIALAWIAASAVVAFAALRRARP